METGYQYELGYDDSRFEIVISQRFHCPICFLVLKDPVMCKNQHYGCSSCIKRHLENSAFCPTCLEPLSVDTLSPAPRIVTDYLSELNIHCDFHSRGCPELVQVDNLKRHVASCGFSPVQCSNVGCNVLVNAKDKLHHEAEVCDFRKLQCHGRGRFKKTRQNQIKGELKAELRNEVEGIKEEMKGEIKVLKEEIKGEMREVKIGMREIKNETKGVKSGMKEMKNEMKEAMKEMKDEIKFEVKEEVKKEMRKMFLSATQKKDGKKNQWQSPQASSSSKRKASVIVAGGLYDEFYLFGLIHRHAKNISVEMFHWPTHSWKTLSPMSTGRSQASSFMHQGQMTVVGGSTYQVYTDSTESLNVANPAAKWKHSAVKLPVRCVGHRVVKYKNQLIMSGGLVEHAYRELYLRSWAVYEIQLVPPYATKTLTTLPQPRFSHGMELFDEKLFILGGNVFDNDVGGKITNSVVQYDLIKNECIEMPPLPYAVDNMATVLWRNTILVLGGSDPKSSPLNTVPMYDVITGRSQMLPCMKRKRAGCTAVLTGNVVVVMGGKDENDKCLKSVECFDLEDQNQWEDLPDMTEARAYATAVAAV